MLGTPANPSFVTPLPILGPGHLLSSSAVRYNETDNAGMVPWVCGMFVLYTPHTNWQMPLYTAEVVFRYPIVGRILFRQSRDDPEMDTTIIIEYLVHADGNAINNTANHRSKFVDARCKAPEHLQKKNVLDSIIGSAAILDLEFSLPLSFLTL
ncbi:hypothetical protein G5I_10739 [Acromyrmex echinatior]|uniref:Uncharacterized protein n=1 Tax=Acromyrmex echinatior TaxID=103372 RepID=F4WXP9_ACREC|nr:hypothetical protein G5I_10739 [Acromyrmex echinatior]